MDEETEMPDFDEKSALAGRKRARLVRTACAAPVALGLVAAGAFFLGAGPAERVTSPALAQAPAAQLPAPPANGVMGFVVAEFHQPVVQDKDACPDGPALRLREAYLETLPKAEAARLRKPENVKEWDAGWQAYAFNEAGANICTNPDMFDRPMQRTVQSQLAWGLDLDGGDKSDTCQQKEFTTPTGETGIDNQEYRAMGCQLEWRGVDGVAADQQVGTQQFHNSGEWTQVILLRGVDSLQNDPEVEVIYANTPDRPVMDNQGKWLTGASFTVSDKAPRERNVLRGKIVDGVLTTETADIKLAGTWGQSAQRDLRGPRGKFDYRKARLQLKFQPDGTLTGLLGGYRPYFDTILSGSLGGAGTALVAGHDCAAQLKTLKTLADGLKDPKTGQCMGISSAQKIRAIPAFVTDLPATRTAAR
jgi:hypothetical protein